MDLVSSPNLKTILSGANLLVDTCTIIDSSKCKELGNFLSELQQNGCCLISIPPVREEYVCSASTRSDYQGLKEYINSIIESWLTIKKDYGNEDFDIVLSRCKVRNPSYVDRLLMKIMCYYGESSEKIYLITSNHHDIPQEIFNCVGFVSYYKGDFHNVGIYEFDIKKYNARKARIDE